MKILSLFNNKGGVGKTTLTFHLSSILAEMGHRVLMIDLDPQCNLSLYAMGSEQLHEIWEPEDPFIDGKGYEASRKDKGEKDFVAFHECPRSIHYLLKPTEEGTGEPLGLPAPCSISERLDLLPGRLTLHMYEYKISDRWSQAYQGDPLSIRTITRIRDIAMRYGSEKNYDYIILDTSPSLGALNKVIISTVDGFIIPCFPDIFSLYGIRNIGNSLAVWKRELDTIYQLISEEKRKSFPPDFVRFLGYTIYNAKRYSGGSEWDLSQAHYNYARQIPEAIKKFIPSEVRAHLEDSMIDTPIGRTSIMHSHATLPAMAQKYNTPIWNVPSCSNLEEADRSTISGNRRTYEATRAAYELFAESVLERVETLDAK